MEATKELVSIVICTYNGEKYLKEQLASLITQTYTFLEIIISDDASTDQTISILKEFAAKDNRIKLFFNSTNLGYNKNFEKAILLANGQMIAISDQDDIWETDKIEKMVKAFPEDALFLYSLSGSFTNDDFENRKPAPKVYYAPIRDLYHLVFNSPVHGHACMFKKALLPFCLPFPETIFYDWWLSMHAASIGTIACLPETLTWHRNHSSNASRTVMQIESKLKRNQKLREQLILFMETFFKTKVLPRAEMESLLNYVELLKKNAEPDFSPPMFFYIMQYRKRIFHYKRKPLVFFSHLKHALRMARTGIL